MQEGSDFLKVRSYARQFRRLYKLNVTLTAISWHPTSKKPSKANSKYFNRMIKQNLIHCSYII
jgi:hypothetical protein